MFSAAVSIGSRLKNWKMNPMWSRRSLVSSVSSSAVISTPATETSPDVGLSSPARMCISVDLPEPDGPITAVSRPSSDVDGHAAQRVDRRVALAVAAHDAAAFDDRHPRTAVARRLRDCVGELMNIHAAVLHRRRTVRRTSRVVSAAHTPGPAARDAPKSRRADTNRSPPAAHDKVRHRTRHSWRWVGMSVKRAARADHAGPRASWAGVSTRAAVGRGPGPVSARHPRGRAALRVRACGRMSPGSGCATLALRRSGRGLREPGDPYVDAATPATERAVAELNSTPPWGRHCSGPRHRREDRRRQSPETSVGVRLVFETARLAFLVVGSRELEIWPWPATRRCDQSRPATPVAPAR